MKTFKTPLLLQITLAA